MQLQTGSHLVSGIPYHNQVYKVFGAKLEVATQLQVFVDFSILVLKKLLEWLSLEIQESLHFPLHVIVGIFFLIELTSRNNGNVLANYRKSFWGKLLRRVVHPESLCVSHDYGLTILFRETLEKHSTGSLVKFIQYLHVLILNLCDIRFVSR